jgi:hypothetical protein
MGLQHHLQVAADAQERAHCVCGMLLPMTSLGPINILGGCCRWLRLGPLMFWEVLPMRKNGPIASAVGCCR